MHCFKKLLIYFFLLVFSKNVCAMDIVPMDIAPGPINSLPQELVYHTVKVLIAGRSDIRYFSTDRKNLETLVRDVDQWIGNARLISKIFLKATDAAITYFECPENVFNFYSASRQLLETKDTFVDSLKVARALHFKNYVQANQHMLDLIHCYGQKATFNVAAATTVAKGDLESKKCIINMLHTVFNSTLKEHVTNFIEENKRYLDKKLMILRNEEKKPVLDLCMEMDWLPLSVFKFYLSDPYLSVLSKTFDWGGALEYLMESENCMNADFRDDDGLSGDVDIDVTSHDEVSCKKIQYITQQVLSAVSEKEQEKFFKITLGWDEVCDYVQEFIAQRIKDSVWPPIIFENDYDITIVQRDEQKPTPWLDKALRDCYFYRPNTSETKLELILVSFIKSSQTCDELCEHLITALARLELGGVIYRGEIICNLIKVYSDAEKALRVHLLKEISDAEKALQKIDEKKD
jgi:hypothetical protein